MSPLWDKPGCLAITIVCGDHFPRRENYPDAGALFARDLALPRMAPHRSQSPSAIRLQRPISRFKRGKRTVSASLRNQASKSEAASLAFVDDSCSISVTIRLKDTTDNRVDDRQGLGQN